MNDLRPPIATTTTTTPTTTMTSSMAAAFGRDKCEHRRLLRQVKSTVAQLFQQAAVVRTAAEADGCCYAEDCDDGGAGGVAAQPQAEPVLRTAADVLRLHGAVEAIFVHGLRVHGPDGTPNCWPFIEALNWLNPTMCQPTITDTTPPPLPANPTPASPPLTDCPAGRVRSDRALRWLYENLADNQLLAKLQYLVSDAEHLNQSYETWAFLQNRRAVGALMQCLRAVEQAHPNLLAQLDVTSCVGGTGSRSCDQPDGPAVQPEKIAHAHHKRSTSHPDFSFGPPAMPRNATAAPKRSCGLRKSASIRERRRQSMQSPPVVLRSRSGSLPNVHLNMVAQPTTCCVPPVADRLPSLTTTAAAALPPAADNAASQTVPTFTYKPPNSPRPPTTPNNSADQQRKLLHELQPISVVRCDNIKIHFDRQHAARISASASKRTALTAASTTPVSAAIPIHRPQPQPPQSLLYSLLPMLGKSPTAPMSADGAGGDDDAGGGSVSPSLYAQLFAASAPSDIVNAFIPREGEKPYDRRPLSSISSLSAAAPADVCERSSSARDHFEQDEGVGDGVECAETTAPCDSEAQRSVALLERSIADPSVKRFLRWAQFSNASSDLDRENAHFIVSEAIISAIEQMKCRKLVAHAQQQQPGDWELMRQRTTDRWPAPGNSNSASRQVNVRHAVARDTNDKYRRAVMSGSSASSSATSSFGSPIGSAMSSTLRLRPVHTGHSSSVSSSEPYSSSPDERRLADGSHQQPAPVPSTSHPPLTPEVDDAAAAIATAAADSGDATADECRAYAEWGATRADTWSAESVALSLIAKFSDRQLPREKNLLWLVSEQDVPQKLLPLPGSWTINPDEPYNIPVVRGTRDWAPPRAQVIFTLHEKLSRKALLQHQNQRCAGCGMRVAAAYSRRFRYCEYLGRYHCTNCHRNQMASIPAHVLHDWDFAVRPVSVFAYRLLEQIATVPVFRMPQLTVEVRGGHVRALQLARQRREQLSYVRDFVVACRFAEEDGTKRVFDQVAAHICDDPVAWSMSDFQAVRAGTFVRDIQAVLAMCERHVNGCQLCTARGFVCELCPRKLVIFPWQANVHRCRTCGVCVHSGCAREPCGRCERMLCYQMAVAD